MYTLYSYPKCSTCRKAKAWLENQKVEFQIVDMITNVPEAAQIEAWFTESDLPIRRLFNTSGMKYRELGLKDQIDSFSIKEASQVLSTDGMLIKRPLLAKENQILAVGFNEKSYEGVLNESWQENI
ncbi:transcriptional regulator, Spx/MgsR family [Enterococcus faecalis 13-SD-W-01]|nr:transcriptional regulator, Spx/MgsR family [Enterococcus faecalis 13-SD-W-01]